MLVLTRSKLAAERYSQDVELIAQWLSTKSLLTSEYGTLLSLLESTAHIALSLLGSRRRIAFLIRTRGLAQAI